MIDPVVLPAMDEPQQQAWHALMDVHERMGASWTLIGGQLVHLHCAERGAPPSRSTDDVDTVVDIRASPEALRVFTAVLSDLGFAAELSGEGRQHRWRRDLAQIDVLVPEGIGERAAATLGAGGAPTLSAPGTTQALRRSEQVRVVVAGRTGSVLRPSLLGALVGKAAARTEITADRAGLRHSIDFVVLAGLASAADLRADILTRKDRLRLARMVARCRSDLSLRSIEGAADALDRLELALDRN